MAASDPRPAAVVCKLSVRWLMKLSARLMAASPAKEMRWYWISMSQKQIVLRYDSQMSRKEDARSVPRNARPEVLLLLTYTVWTEETDSNRRNFFLIDTHFIPEPNIIHADSLSADYSTFAFVLCMSCVGWMFQTIASDSNMLHSAWSSGVVKIVTNKCVTEGPYFDFECAMLY